MVRTLRYWAGLVALVNFACGGDSKGNGLTPPIAHAGPDILLESTGTDAQMDGSESDDPDGVIETYEWTLMQQPPTSGIVLENRNTPFPWLVPDVEGEYLISLVVTDDDGLRSIPDVLMVATPRSSDPNQRPIADLVLGGEVGVGSTLFLDASGSSDPDGDPLNFTFSLEAQPLGASTFIDHEGGALAQLTPDSEGTWIIGLRVDDGISVSERIDLMIPVDSGTNRAPTADAGPDQSLESGTTISLDGLASFDPEGDSLTFSWTLIDAPTDSVLSTSDISGSDQALASLEPDVDGFWTFGLEVCDALPLCGTDEVVYETGVTVSNEAPVADAGPDQLVELDSTVMLDGTGSFDPDGDALDFSWEFDTIPEESVLTNADLTDGESAQPAFVPDALGTFVLVLTTCDPASLCDTDTVEVEVWEEINTPPLCDAGPDWNVETGETVTLDASASTDPDGDPLIFYWTLSSTPAGSTANIDDRSAEITTMVPDLAGDYRINLWASDGTDSCFDRVDVTAISTNTSPIADAGPDQTTSTGDTVLLDGSGSTDADGDPLTYAWSIDATPAGSGITDGDIDAASTSSASFVPDVDGTYTLSLEVCDTSSACDTDDVDIAVSAPPNTAPSCDAGTDQSITLGDSATLDGTGSSDADGDPLTYAWAITRSPAGSSIVIDDTTASLTSATPDIEGDYRFTLWVNDGTESCSDSVDVEVIRTNTAPSCDAGTSQEITVGEVATLDGSGSTDSDGDTLTYFWGLSRSPTGSSSAIDDPGSVITTLEPDLPGEYRATLWVNDGADSCSDWTTVTALSANTAPIADAGPDASITLGDTATLDGSGSSDADGDTLTYSWSLDSVPATSSATDSDIGGASTDTATLTPDVEGTFGLSLEVCDPTGDCDTDTTDIVVVLSTNNPPTCDAGSDLSGETGEILTLDGSGSSDSDGDPLGYFWGLSRSPTGSTTTIDDWTSDVATLIPDIAGDYRVTLWVNDGTDSCSDSANITVVSGNAAPIADAGSDREDCSLSRIELDGSDSSDPDGDPLSYLWELDSTPAGSALSSSDIIDADTVSASLLPDIAGSYVFTLSVDDGQEVDTASVTISAGGSGAVAVLHLDAASGSTAYDDSGYVNDAVLTDTEWTGGRFFSGLEFDGSSSYGEIQDDDSLDLVDTLTIEWWMRTDAIVTGYQAIFMKGYPYNYSAWSYEEQLLFYAYTPDGTTTSVTADTSLGDGEWHHYAVTLGDGELILYEDGVEADSTSFGGELEPNTGELWLGRPEWTDSLYLFEGGLDELIIYDETLGSSEIEARADSTLQYCTDEADTDSPEIEITSPSDGESIGSSLVTVTGRASDESAIVSVEVDGVSATATDLDYDTWSADITLSEGSQTITVVATDIAGNTGSASIRVDVLDVGCGGDDSLLLTMDEDTAGTAADESPNGLDATGIDTERVTGIHGNAVRFDGLTSYMVVPDDDAINMTGDFSIEAWFRRDGLTSDYEVIAIKGNYNYALVLYGDYAIFAYTDSSSDTHAVTAEGFNDGSWHHLIGVYDGSEVLIYVDGNLEGSTTAGGAPLTNSEFLFLGGVGPASYNLDGEVDQLRLHDFALSSSEISQLYSDPPACMPSENLSPSGTATASDVYSADYPASRVIDDDTDESSVSPTYWMLPDFTTGWVEVDLGREVAITDILWANTHAGSSYDGATTNYEIAISTTGSFTGEETVVDSGTGTMETDLVYHPIILSTPVTGRYVRFYVDGYTGRRGGLNELRIYGLE